jgi:hypothetical protein
MHDHHPDTGRPAGAAEPANLTTTRQPVPNEGDQPTASHSMRLMSLLRADGRDRDRASPWRIRGSLDPAV